MLGKVKKKKGAKRMRKKEKKYGARFGMGIITGVILLLAMFSYFMGAAFYGYYSDFNIFFVIKVMLSGILGIFVALFYEKKGDKAGLRLLSLLCTVILTVSLMQLIEGRVYSIAVLMLSDLERDNLEGYYALYYSIGSMGLLFIAIICNCVGNFIKPKTEKMEK